MEASKVTIDNSKIEYYKGMSRKQRKRLQRKKIKEYIRSKSPDTPISNVEFSQLIGLTSDAGAHAILSQMVKDGTLSRERAKGGNGSYAYMVNGDVEVVKPADPKPKQTQTELVTEKAPEPAPVSDDPKDLEFFAKEFAWRNNSDSVREFVKWMRDKELDLRRYGK